MTRKLAILKDSKEAEGYIKRLQERLCQLEDENLALKLNQIRVDGTARDSLADNFPMEIEYSDAAQDFDAAQERLKAVLEKSAVLLQES